ncbi:TIM barrel protein [candidate division KSB3 bacterium]|uniref:TIM barrel protein n=1 Tax=candidate division KSB3 bacterium TaxID=2044937 RepID=A0A9D5JT28_9BACT|nr:TIM barrel protein [candidate division KSB3 bacterium]MBD3323554.1 TIM barrel protein [candidate division KSB3 bacterium]
MAIDRSRIGLNRIIYPGLGLEDFFKLAAELDIHKVELRNDLPNVGIIDGHMPAEVKAFSDTYGVQIITINALQHFNLGSRLQSRVDELRDLVSLAADIECEALVLCPHNDVNDTRSAEACFQETVAALKAFAPIFEDSGLMGYVEPLGFQESSLSSLVTAVQAIQASGCQQYKIVYDTFHHHLGPDTPQTVENEYDVAYTGLIHISGIESEIPSTAFRDEHRILVGAADKLKTREQVQKLVALGYTGAISFEPFADVVHHMSLEEIKAAIQASIGYLLEE